MSADTIFLLPVVFVIALAVALLTYWVGGRISPKPSGTNSGKTAPYACGEDMPAEESKFDMERFLIFAVYFLVFDVFAFLMATSLYAGVSVPVIYSLIVLGSVAMLVFSRRHL